MSTFWWTGSDIFITPEAQGKSRRHVRNADYEISLKGKGGFFWFHLCTSQRWIHAGSYQQDYICLKLWLDGGIARPSKDFVVTLVACFEYKEEGSVRGLLTYEERLISERPKRNSNVENDFLWVRVRGSLLQSACCLRQKWGRYSKVSRCQKL